MLKKPVEKGFVSVPHQLDFSFLFYESSFYSLGRPVLVPVNPSLTVSTRGPQWSL